MSTGAPTSRWSSSLTLLVAAAAGVAALATLGLTSTGAQAAGNQIGGQGAGYYLSDSFSPKATTAYSYGAASDQVYVGDWDGNGTDTLAVRRGTTFFFRNSHTSGPADVVVEYGNVGDVVLVGDWDGDGVDTLAVRRGNQYHIKNSISSGKADTVIHYGDTSDTVLAGDWDGNGTDTLAVRRGTAFFFKNSMTTGVADHVIHYGNTGDRVLTGDWDGNGTDTLAVRRDATYYLKNSISSGVADSVVPYGDTTDTTLVGDWDGNGSDTLGVRRIALPGAPAPLLTRFGPGTVTPTQLEPGAYRAPGGPGCGWARLSGLGGTVDDVITDEDGAILPIVSISSSDAAFTSTGCGTWRLVQHTYPAVPATSMSDGTFVVDRHIAAASYTAPGGPDCSWRRLTDFSGAEADIVADGHGQTNPSVQLLEHGFSSSGCGTWTKLN